MGHILTIYSKTTITINTKLLRWVHNFPTKFQSCRFNGLLEGVGLQGNTFDQFSFLIFQVILHLRRKNTF